MTGSIRPLWQLLAAAANLEETSALNCDECFAILLHLADRAVAGADLESLRRIARHHLRRCPDCRAQHLERLRQIEAGLAAMQHSAEDS